MSDRKIEGRPESPVAVAQKNTDVVAPLVDGGNIHFAVAVEIARDHRYRLAADAGIGANGETRRRHKARQRPIFERLQRKQAKPAGPCILPTISLNPIAP